MTGSIGKRVALGGLTVVTATVASVLVLVAVLEVFPGLIDRLPLESIEYYAIRKTYQPDPELAFVYRTFDEGGPFTYLSRGDLYSPTYGVDVPFTRFDGANDRNGFRASGDPPWDIVLLGDSYLEIGESLDDTFSAALREAAGLRTQNLGRAWYGPNQYLKVLRRYAKLRPGQIVILCFFDGNDIHDIYQYRQWQRTGRYHFYRDVASLPFWRRYVTAVDDTKDAVLKWIADRVPSRVGNVHPNVALVKVGDTLVPMAFAYWNRMETVEQLLEIEEWKVMRQLVAEFRELCLAQGATPVILYIPTKAQTYGRLITSQSGSDILYRLPGQLKVENNDADVLGRIASAERVSFINLLPYFQERAGSGELLYYPFDTHWNRRGRELAGQFVARALTGR